jgi:flagellar biosynthesis/type III secretory pathway protein FliH
VRKLFSEREVQRYTHAELEHFLSPCSFARGEAEVKSEPADSEVETAPGEVDSDGPPLPSIEELLAVAQQQAESIVAVAQQEVEQWRTSAQAEGFATGREEGHEQARQALLPALVAFAQAGQSLIVLEERLIERMTPNLVSFALEIAEKIVGKTVVEDPRIVAAVLERARAELPQARSIRIYLHPLDQQVLSECRPDLVWTGTKAGRTIEVVAAEEIERGGCRVETEMGIVDASIPVQIEEVRRQVLE